MSNSLKNQSLITLEFLVRVFFINTFLGIVIREEFKFFSRYGRYGSSDAITNFIFFG